MRRMLVRSAVALRSLSAARPSLLHRISTAHAHTAASPKPQTQHQGNKKMQGGQQEHEPNQSELPDFSVEYASSNPAEHSSTDVNKIYILDDKAHQLISEGYCGDLRKILTPVDRSKRADHWLDILDKPEHPGVLVRESTMTVIDELQNAAKEKKLGELGAFILDGKEGSGKSMALNHIVHWAKASGWLVAFIPQASELLRAKDRFARTPEGIIMQPSLARSLLHSFHQGNRHVLSQVKVKSTLPSTFDNCSTLEDVVAAGSGKLELSLTALAIFRKELTLATEVPVLIAVDEINMLHGPSEFADMTDSRRSRLSATQLLVASMFNGQGAEKMTNGTIVGACTRTGKGVKTDVDDPSHSFVIVPSYSRDELEQIVRFYGESGHSLLEDDAVDAFVTFLQVFSCGRGRYVHKHAALYSGLIDHEPSVVIKNTDSYISSRNDNTFEEEEGARF